MNFFRGIGNFIYRLKWRMMVSRRVRCPVCDGSGREENSPCSWCDGRGKVGLAHILRALHRLGAEISIGISRR